MRGAAGRACRTALVAMAAWLAQSVAFARAATVLILNSNFPADERRLEESLRIYTRDMGIRIIIAGDSPASVENDALEALGRQAQKDGADVVVWTGRRSDGTAVYYVLSVHDRDLRETEIAEPGGSRAAETVALKVRTILVRQRLSQTGDAADVNSERPSLPRPPREANGSPPAQGNQVASDATLSTAPTAPGPAASAPAPLDGDASRKRAVPGRIIVEASRRAPAAEAGPPRRARGSLEASYSAALPLDGAWYRQGLTITAEARLGGGPLHAYVDGAVTNRSQLTGANFTVTLRDLPFGAGVLWRWELDHLSFAAGPRAALHVIEARSSLSDGNSGSARQLSGALGAVGKIELKWRGRLRLGVGVVCEALLPDRTFTVGGAPAIHTGALQVGLLVGFAVLIP